jgi:putative hydrolase of the HAD superfamily
MITTVIFDLDGTLTDCDLELAKTRTAQALSSMTGQPYEAVLTRMDHIHYRCNVESIYDRNVWWDEFAGVLSPEEKQRLTDIYWNHVMKTTMIKPHAEHMLSELKKRGLQLVLLTDFDGQSFSKRKRIQNLPIIDYFDLVVIAGDDTPETKPSPQPYNLILHILDAEPRQVLMIGDKPSVDLSGARSLGMHTLLLVGDYGEAWENTIDDLRQVLPFVQSLQKKSNPEEW